jgi:hypothetical protein
MGQLQTLEGHRRAASVADGTTNDADAQHRWQAPDDG